MKGKLSFFISKIGEGDEKSWPQVLAVIVGCLVALNCGMQISWSSPFLPKITKDPDYDISEDQASYFSVIEPATMMVTCLLFSTLSDIIGRKETLQLIAIPQLLSWILTAMAKSAYVFYAARIFAGVADGGMFSILPVYIGEICCPEVRGTWGNTMVFSTLFGELMIILIGKYMGVQETSYISIFLVLVFFVSFFLMPESPYFYLMKEMDQDAIEALQFLRWKKDINAEYLSLKSDVQRQISGTGTWKDLLRISSNRKALIAGIFMRFSLVFGGVLTFLMNTQFVCEKAGVGENSGLASETYLALACIVLYCIVNLLVIIFLSDKLPRRTTYVISLLLSGLVLVVLALYFYVDQNVPELEITSPWVPITGMMFYQVFSSLGLMFIPTLMLGELFSASIKSKGMTVIIIAFGFLLFLSNYALFALTRLMDLCGPFFLYGVCCILSAVASFHLIPETKGKTLEEIQQTFKGNTNTSQQKQRAVDL